MPRSVFAPGLPLSDEEGRPFQLIAARLSWARKIDAPYSLSTKTVDGVRKFVFSTFVVEPIFFRQVG
jgi:hypothetical protein